MSDLDKRILSQVCSKEAVELLGHPATGDLIDVAEAVDKLARALYERHVAWIQELCQPEEKPQPQQNEQTPIKTD